jgi:hypothetical protein
LDASLKFGERRHLILFQVRFFFIIISFIFFNFSKKKDKKRSKYVALDFSADFLLFVFVNLRKGEKNPKKQIQKKKKKKKSDGRNGRDEQRCFSL